VVRQSKLLVNEVGELARRLHLEVASELPVIISVLVRLFVQHFWDRFRHSAHVPPDRAEVVTLAATGRGLLDRAIKRGCCLVLDGGGSHRLYRKVLRKPYIAANRTVVVFVHEACFVELAGDVGRARVRRVISLVRVVFGRLVSQVNCLHGAVRAWPNRVASALQLISISNK